MCSEPLELEYLYTALPGYELLLHDGVASRSSPLALARHWQPDVVLFTAYITDVGTVIKLARQLKGLTKAPLIFVGGVQAEVTPKIFDDEAIDGVFYHNQLQGIAATLHHIQHSTDFTLTPGALFRRDGALQYNPPGGETMPLPIPKRVLFERNPSRYRYLHYRKCAVVKSSFGCPGQCSFCFCRQMNGGKYTVRDLDTVIAEIAGIEAAETIFIVDDNFLVNRARVLEFCDKLQASGINKQFIVYGTASFIADNPTIMARLREIGLRSVIVGFEFISDNALHEVAKSTSVANNDATVAICERLGIDLIALFIVDPQWHHADFRALAAYLQQKQLTFATFSVLTQFPDNSEVLPADTRWWRYNLLHLHAKPTHMSPDRFYCWLMYLYLLPGLNISSLRRMIRQCGFWQAMRTLLLSSITGVEQLGKLLLWR